MSRPPAPTALQRLLSLVDRAATSELGIPCETRFGRLLECEAGDVTVGVVKQATGRYAYRMDGQRLRSFDGLPRMALDKLRDLQQQIREHDTLQVSLGQQRYRIRLFPPRESHKSYYGILAGRQVSLPPADEPGGAPTSREHEERLKAYLALLQTQQAVLQRFLDGLNQHVPAPLARMEMVTETVFTDGQGVTSRDLKLLPTLGCNQHCLFCCASEPRKPFSTERLRAVLLELHRTATDLDRTRLSFSGGEPTLHPELGALMRYARELGFPWLGLQTNGVRLSKPALAQQILGAPLQQVIVSLHSLRPEVYDRLTGTRGQLPRALEGLGQVLAHPSEQVLVNIVLNRLNVDELPDYVDFIAGLEHRADTSVSVMPSIVFMNSDNGHWSDLVIPHREVVESLREAVARQPSLFVRMQGDCFLPFCLGAEYPELAALAPTNRAESPTVYVAQRAPGPVPERVRVKHEDCRGCGLDSLCGGVCGAYARTQGLGELEPQ